MRHIAFLPSIALLWLTCGSHALSVQQAPSSLPAADLEVRRWSRWLLEGSGEELPVGRTSDSRISAINRLTEIGSPEAVDALYQFMLRPDVGRGLRQATILALGKIGSEPALAALDRYTQWVEEGRHVPHPFGFGRRELPVFHYGSTDVTPAAQGRDAAGVSWAIFPWARLRPVSRQSGAPDAWITRSTDERNWEPPVYLGQVEHPERFLVELTTGQRKLLPYLKDSDADALADLVEARLGTDPARADSDADGVPDGVDGNPLTPRRTLETDEDLIRQAAFLAFFGSSTSEYPIYTWDHGNEQPERPGKRPSPQYEYVRQEYYGYRGPVLRVTSPPEGHFCFTGLEVEITSPTTATAQISDYEGPLAGSMSTIQLRKVHGKWVAVELQLVGVA